MVLYSPVRARHSACSRRTGIRTQPRRVKQTVAGRIAERGVKCCGIEYCQLVIRLVRIGQIRIANAQIQSQAGGHFPVIVEIELKVLPAALLLENDILFAPIERHVLQNIISRTVAGIGERNAAAPWISNVFAAIVTVWTEGHALFL